MTEPDVIKKLEAFKDAIIAVKTENKRLREENLNLKIQIDGYEKAAKDRDAQNASKAAYDAEMTRLIEEAEALLNADDDN